jgi:hypothetical protein
MAGPVSCAGLCRQARRLWPGVSKHVVQCMSSHIYALCGLTVCCCGVTRPEQLRSSVPSLSVVVIMSYGVPGW